MPFPSRRECIITNLSPLTTANRKKNSNRSDQTCAASTCGLLKDCYFGSCHSKQVGTPKAKNIKNNKGVFGLITLLP